MTLPTMTGEFRAVTDVSLKFAPSGTAVASFTGVADKKKKNEATGEWEDDKVIFVRITGFKKVAENMAASIAKGTTVTVTGPCSVNEWQTKEGEKRQTVEIIANEVGLSLKWDAAKSERTEGGNSTRAASPAKDDPWSTAPQQSDSATPPPF